MRMTFPATSIYWTFTANDSGNYNAVLTNPAADDATVVSGTMTLDSFTPASVVIRIVAGGHTAIANGKSSGAGNVMSGDWSNDAGQGGTFTITWDTSGPHPYNLPVRLSECEGNMCGGVWTFQDGHGAAKWPNGAFALLTVDHLDFDRIVIKRIDSAGSTPGLTAVYTGKIVGNRIEGDVTWTWRASNSGKWSATIIKPDNYTLLNYNLPCDSSFNGTGAEAADRGANSMEAKNFDKASCWFHLGASNGDANAEGFLASLLYLGLTGPRDFPESFRWANKAAEQGNYLGERCLSLMYKKGEGVAQDLKLAEYWNTLATQTKAAQILAERQAQAAAQQRAAQEANQMQAPQEFSRSAAMFLLSIFGAAVGSDSPNPRYDFQQQMTRGYQNMCMGGDSHACSIVGK